MEEPEDDKMREDDATRTDSKGVGKGVGKGISGWMERAAALMVNVLDRQRPVPSGDSPGASKDSLGDSRDFLGDSRDFLGTF